MKLHQILQEQEDKEDKEDNSIEKIAEQIKQDCSLYLNNKQSHNDLVRGVQRHTDPVVFNKPLDERFDSWSEEDLEYTKYLHRLMQQDGFKATRLNGYFVYPAEHIEDAEFFGTPYYVFPVGDYSLTWNTVQLDLGGGTWIRYGFEGSGLEQANVASLSDQQLQDRKRKIVRSFWDINKKYFKQGRDVDAAIKPDSEIMIKADFVHLIRADIYENNKEYLLDYWY